MIDTLTMQYNRGRQAAITNELVDIITGTLHRSTFYGGKLGLTRLDPKQVQVLCEIVIYSACIRWLPSVVGLRSR